MSDIRAARRAGRFGRGSQTPNWGWLGLSIVLVSALFLLGATVARPQSALADASILPPYTGQSFPPIQDPSGPEEFSWRVELGDEQVLRLINDQLAEVEYNDRTPAFEITATPAADADGSSVPTTLSVSEGDVLTLTVHHRAGNPAAGGASFVYPISAGSGWRGGFHTEVVHLESSAPPLEAQPPSCIVPRLKGSTLKGARKLLVGASCSIAAVGKANGVSMATGRVVRQGPRPGWILAPGSGVNIRLG